MNNTYLTPEQEARIKIDKVLEMTAIYNKTYIKEKRRRLRHNITMAQSNPLESFKNKSID